MSTTQSTAYGFGIATQNQSGQTLECSFYALGLGKAPENNIDATFKSLIGEDPIRKVKKVAVEVVIQINEKPKDAADVYLRLHLLSHRILKPHTVNLEGIFSLLANVVWTSAGACEIDGFEKVRPQLISKYANLVVYGVDKFPRMVDYVIPSGVRIADADRVRLGAHLAPGTTVMHEGFVNFNAGTLGTSMVEGRISAGVVVGDGSDVGGGASIMGTLSGGGKEIISIGEKCLLGANSGLGISLGNNCVIESGTYVTAAAKIRLPDGEIVKTSSLSGASNLLFRRNSLDGCLEVIMRTGSWGGLNSVLHSN